MTRTNRSPFSSPSRSVHFRWKSYGGARSSCAGDGSHGRPPLSLRHPWMAAARSLDIAPTPLCPCAGSSPAGCSCLAPSCRCPPPDAQGIWHVPPTNGPIPFLPNNLKINHLLAQPEEESTDLGIPHHQGPIARSHLVSISSCCSV